MLPVDLRRGRWWWVSAGYKPAGRTGWKPMFRHIFENFVARFSEKEIGQRRLRHKTGLRRFWRWSSRESAWPISKLILAMGGTLGPAPKAMQLSRPSLLSYLQRFNKKRRLNYKIDLLPRLSGETASARIREPVKIPSRIAGERFGVDGKARAASTSVPH